MKLKVTHVEGSKKGSIDNFDAPVVTVGRDPSNTLVFDAVKDDRVSTKHAALSEQGGAVIVTDLGSRNGTFVNGQRISGPTPVASGGLVQFGENGPMIMVAFESSAPAPAPAAPVKKGGGGACLVLLLLAVLVLGGGGVGGWFLFLRGPKDPWAHYGPGSVFVTSSESRMEKPVVAETKIEAKHTISSKTPEAVKLKVEITVGSNTSTNEVEMPLHPKGDGHAEKPLEERHESITTPAGTFSCHYEKRMKDGATNESWKSDEVPFPIKVVSTSEGRKSTTTLIKLEKK